LKTQSAQWSVSLPCYHSDVLLGVILNQFIYTDDSADSRHER